MPPAVPGVYKLRDRKGGILYAGVTGNLKKRAYTCIRNEELMAKRMTMECAPTGHAIPEDAFGRHP